jgi:hypothetical protein
MVSLGLRVDKSRILFHQGFRGLFNLSSVSLN